MSFKKILLLFLVLFCASTYSVAQDEDIGDLESLEAELDALESGDGDNLETGEEAFEEEILAEEINEEEKLDDLEDELSETSGEEVAAEGEDLEDLAEEDLDKEFEEEFEDLDEEEVAEGEATEQLDETLGEEASLEDFPEEENGLDDMKELQVEEEGPAGFEGIPEEASEEIATPEGLPDSEEEPSFDVVEEQIVAEPEEVESKPEFAPIPDVPDFGREKSIARAYRNLRKNPIEDDEWQQIIGERATEVYDIRLGDTLWDISVTFFGNGYFWPKLWQLNSNITNPHLLSSGKQLQFIEGDLENAPEITNEQGQVIAEASESAEPGEVEEEFVEQEESAEEEILEEEDEQLVAEEELEEEIEPSQLFPELPPAPSVVPRLEKIPPSLGAWHTAKSSGEDLAKVQTKKMEIFSRQNYNIPYIFRGSLPNFVGEVIEIEQGSDSAQLYQYVFVRLDQGGVGDVFSSYLPTEALEKDGDVMGFPIVVQGQLKVVETVDAEKNYFKALITKNIAPVTVGSKLLQKLLPNSRWTQDGEFAEVSGKLIGGQFDNSRKVLGLGSLVYLDKGTQDGLAVGSLLNIMQNQSRRVKDSKISNNTREVGALRVVDADEIRSTGVIVDAKTSIYVGDTIGKVAKLFIPGDSQPEKDGVVDNDSEATDFADDSELEDEDVELEDF